MVREIKFRGKRVDNGEWVYGSLIFPLDKPHIFEIKTEKEIMEMTFDELDERTKEVIPETVGEFTGLLDRQGNEVYEGDIINHYGFKSEFIVRFGTYKRKDFSNNDRQEKHHGFYGKPISNFDERTQIEWNADIESLVNFRNGVEVIGNEFENPELLSNGK